MSYLENLQTIKYALCKAKGEDLMIRNFLAVLVVLLGMFLQGCATTAHRDYAKDAAKKSAIQALEDQRMEQEFIYKSKRQEKD